MPDSIFPLLVFGFGITGASIMSTWFMNDFLFLEIRINLDLEDEKC